MQTKRFNSEGNQSKIEKTENSWPIDGEFSRQEKRAMEIIYKHSGKRKVFETYLKYNPAMARKYLKFIASNPWAQYMVWDTDESRFKLSA